MKNARKNMNKGKVRQKTTALCRNAMFNPCNLLKTVASNANLSQLYDKHNVEQFGTLYQKENFKLGQMRSRSVLHKPIPSGMGTFQKIPSIVALKNLEMNLGT